jgi:hypothetical protein
MGTSVRRYSRADWKFVGVFGIREATMVGGSVYQPDLGSSGTDVERAGDCQR